MERRFCRPPRRGMVTLDYVMVLAVAFPLAFILLQLLVQAYAALHEFITATVGWAIL